MNIDFELLNDVVAYNQLRRYCNFNNIDFIKNDDYERILSSRYMKVSRLKKDIVYLFHTKKYVWFLTFTFDDNYIIKCDRTKRDLIKHSLQYSDFKYILNVDYGSRTEREHYHCILGTDEDINLKYYLKWNYPCFTDARLCSTSEEDKKRLTKYLNKLTNHCLKDSTKNKRIYKNFKSYPMSNTEKKKTQLYKDWFFAEFKGK